MKTLREIKTSLFSGNDRSSLLARRFVANRHAVNVVDVEGSASSPSRNDERLAKAYARVERLTAAARLVA